MSTGKKRVRHSDASQARSRATAYAPQPAASGSEEPLIVERVQPGPRCDAHASEGRKVPTVTEPVRSLGVSLAEDEKGRGAAELQVGDARYLLDHDQVDYLIHMLIRMRRSIQ